MALEVTLDRARGAVALLRGILLRRSSLASVLICAGLSAGLFWRSTRPGWDPPARRLGWLDPLDPSKRLNLCNGGHFVPEFFVLGAQKASTTTLCENGFAGFVRPDPPPGKPRWFSKEPAIFDQPMSSSASFGQHMASIYPPCDQHNRQVAMDCTPNYFTYGVTAFNGSARIAAWYGGAGSARLRFVIVLREPLSRAASAFNHLHKDGFMKIPGVSSFEGYVKQVLARDQSAPGYSCLGPDPGTLQGSFYVPLIQNFFEAFSSSQFTILPTGLIHSPEQIADLSEHVSLGVFGIARPKYARPGFHIANELRHQSVEEVLASRDLEDLRSLVRRCGGDSRSVAELLEPSQADLYRFSEPRRAPHIAEWLSANWS